jgi:hypothetical protein
LSALQDAVLQLVNASAHDAPIKDPECEQWGTLMAIKLSNITDPLARIDAQQECMQVMRKYLTPTTGYYVMETTDGSNVVKITPAGSSADSGAVTEVGESSI